MGKVPKAVKTVERTENKSKVKKLLNNPGINKASSKANLKDARAPLSKMVLKNKSNIVNKNVQLIEDPKSIKKNKKLLKNVKNSGNKPVEVELKVEPVSIMKTLKRKSNSENNVKLPVAKKKVASPAVQLKKEAKKKAVKQEIPETENEKTAEILRNDKSKVDEPILKKNAKVETEKSEGIINLDKAQVVKGVSAVLKLAKIQAERKKNLFDGEHQPIFLQVTCIKVPKVPKRRLRMMLPHTLVTDTDDVVLFVGDLKKGRAQDFEPTINHYKDFLQEKQCMQIKDVIPLTQVKTEYDQYELKRKLLSSYDFFLTDGKIAGHLSHLLGKIFADKRKLPTSVKMDSKNLKLEIDNALRKTSMQFHSHGNSHIVQVAHTDMKKQDILNNVLCVCKNLAQHYPGGWINIRSLILKTAHSLPVPIYVTLKSKNKVKVPVVVPPRPKAHRTVSGELSTAPGNTMVIVRPDGTVETQRIRKKKTGNKGDDESAVTESNLTTDESVGKKSKRNKKKTTKTEDTKENEKPAVLSNLIAKEDSEEEISEPETKAKRFEDSEDEIEEAEQAYLSRWQEESTTTISEGKKQKKEATKEKKKKTKIVKKKKTKTSA